MPPGKGTRDSNGFPPSAPERNLGDLGSGFSQDELGVEGAERKWVGHEPWAGGPVLIFAH